MIKIKMYEYKSGDNFLFFLINNEPDLNAYLEAFFSGLGFNKEEVNKADSTYLEGSLTVLSKKGLTVLVYSLEDKYYGPSLLISFVGKVDAVREDVMRHFSF